MNEIFQEAFVLMGVGMITVFVILFLVVGVGTLLIKLVNRYFPEVSQPIPNPTSNISPAKLAAITAAVSSLTQGKGSIQHIEKIP